MYLSCDTKKYHDDESTHIIFGRPPIGGSFPPFPLAAPLSWPHLLLCADTNADSRSTAAADIITVSLLHTGMDGRADVTSNTFVAHPTNIHRCSLTLLCSCAVENTLTIWADSCVMLCRHTQKALNFHHCSRSSSDCVQCRSVLFLSLVLTLTHTATLSLCGWLHLFAKTLF